MVAKSKARYRRHPLRMLSMLAPSLFYVMLVWTTPSRYVHAQSTSAPSSEVKLSLHEFQELYSSASLKDAERRVLDQQKMQKAEHDKKMKELETSTIKQGEQQRQELRHMFPTNFQVLQHQATGVFNSSSPHAGVEGDVATFSFQLTLRVMDSFAHNEHPWTVVPLVNTTSTVAAQWKVFLQTQPSTDDEEPSFEEIDPVLDPSVLLLQRDEQLVLATNRSGLFQLEYEAFTRVGKTRNLNSVGLSNLLYPLSTLEFAIAKTSPRSTSRDFSVQPPSSVLHVLPKDNTTELHVTLPLTADSFQIRWVDVQEETTKPPAAAKEQATGGNAPSKATSSKPVVPESPTGPPQVTVSTESMHTVAEGILRSVHTLEFETTSELTPLNAVQFVVKGERVRVTSVSGHALQSWNTQEYSSNDNKGNSTTKAPNTAGSLVTATFKTSQLSSSVILKVHTESDRGESKQAKVSLPRVECKNVLRQTGSIAVVKDANVEVHESKTSGLSRVEAADLPSQLRLNVDRPIVLSYKYLNPNHDAVFSVKEHTAMDTLEATIDRLHYQTVVTETHMVHSMILILQSTKLQYLELLNLPLSASKFSVLVNSESTKPVRSDDSFQDGTASILVPLMVGLNPETANRGESLQTSVEVTFFSTHETLGTNGTLALNLPQFDLPVSVLSTRLSLPSQYDYNFTGSFGTKPHDKSTIHPIPEAFRYVKGKRVVREDHTFTVLDDMFPEDREEQGKSGAVRIVTPNAGQNYYFQKLLVLDGKLELNVIYGPHPKPAEETKEPKTIWNRLFSKNSS